MFRSAITDSCYPDPFFKTLTMDIGYYINRVLPRKIKVRTDGKTASMKESSGTYSKEKFLEEVYMTEEEFDTLASLLRNKKNIILQGAPGVGKTFAAKRLAYAIMGEKDDERIEFIQFHQNYSYEDFIMGYKPQGQGFELQHGIFYGFCQKAANKPDQPFFFIIDEINRGNMIKIFGELLMLIEKDYRGVKATLAYSGKPFAVPKNLYIIGMMNTADRSLAMIDYALRRRFSFFEMKLAFNSKGFKAYQVSLDNETFDTLIERIRELNKEITIDSSLGKGLCIGHSYFCGEKFCSDEWMKEVVEYDIIPMLKEYWFDEEKKFVLEYYRYHHLKLAAAPAQISWNVDDGVVDFLPVMKTDITLSFGEKILIIDTKYYSHTMQTHKQYDSRSLHSSNLYQIFTYVKNKDVGNTGNVAGMLLYAKTEETITADCDFKMGGNKISVKTLDLNISFPNIAKQLDRIALTYFEDTM